jgi:sulfur-oxidizing protein SoxY
MTPKSPPWSPVLSRRGFIVLASTSVPALFLESAWAGPARLSAFEREHVPILRLPAFTGNKAKVPIVVEMNHPMTPDHYIKSIEVVNSSDEVPVKGRFHFTPANGGVYLAFQARMDPGSSEVSVTAECNRHGKCSTKQAIQVDDAGGCAGGEPAVRRTDGEDVHAPEIRIAELIKEGRLRPGDLVHAQVKLRHPNRRAPPSAAGEPEPLYLETLEAFYGDERAGRFEMTAATSEDPFVTFGLKVQRQQALRVVLVNNRGQRLEAKQEIRFA